MAPPLSNAYERDPATTGSFRGHGNIVKRTADMPLLFVINQVAVYCCDHVEQNPGPTTVEESLEKLLRGQAVITREIKDVKENQARLEDKFEKLSERKRLKDDFQAVKVCDEVVYSLQNTVKEIQGKQQLLQPQVDFLNSGGSQESEITNIKSVVVCYWNASSVLRRPPRDYDLNKLCVHCCTHLVYLGASIDPRTLAPVFQEDDSGLKSVRDMDALKTSHPLLKLVLSLRLSGSPAELSKMVDGAEAVLARAALAKNVARWLPEHNFDGVEVDWDRLPEELKSVYVDLVKAVRTVTKKMRLQTVVSVHPKWGPSYDVEALHGLSDLLILHPYSKEDSPKMAQPPVLFKEDLVETCEVVLSQLRSRKRVVLALPLFGFAYRLRNSGHYELRASVRGPAPPGPFTDFRGLLAYFEICLEFSSDLWVSLYDKEAECKIAVNRDKSQWIGYDNKATILNKV
ncbi:chitinase-3-like protein 2 [Ixodes scapularis]|uniref:chitinase-3-like protein 2 n=1 Tax=Ixodes scapularis TaxID=6945 RepID=UPI001C390788|nr:chitinase-3-like protein 2 [Ixodes scapularis]